MQIQIKSEADVDSETDADTNKVRGREVEIDADMLVRNMTMSFFGGCNIVDVCMILISPADIVM
jgi:hypothetical protein